MALQWLILTYVVAAEAALALLLTLPSPKLLKNRLVSLISLIVQPALFIIPFAGFQLLGFLAFFLLYWFPFAFSVFNEMGFWFFNFLLADIYWKNEHRLTCTSEICTAAERDRFEKSVSVWLSNFWNLIIKYCFFNWNGLLDIASFIYQF